MNGLCLPSLGLSRRGDRLDGSLKHLKKERDIFRFSVGLNRRYSVPMSARGSVLSEVDVDKGPIGAFI